MEGLEMMEEWETMDQQSMMRSWTDLCPSLKVGLSIQALLEPMEVVELVVFHSIALSFEGGLDCGGNQKKVRCGNLYPVTLGSPGYGQGPLGPADIRSATRLPSQPPGPPGVPLMIRG